MFVNLQKILVLSNNSLKIYLDLKFISSFGLVQVLVVEITGHNLFRPYIIKHLGGYLGA